MPQTPTRVPWTLESPPVRFDTELMRNCKKWNGALHEINKRAADFVAAERTNTYQQLKYRAAMFDMIKNLQSKMNSAEVKEQLRDAAVGTEIDVFQDYLRANMKDIMKGGMERRDLENTMKILTDKGSMLQKTLDLEISNLKSFTSQCNEMLLGTTPENRYFLDICAVRAKVCINEEGSSHVGCCCGVLPTAGMYDIAGKTSMRRLSTTATSDIDVCGEAYKMSKGNVSGLVRRTKQYKRGPEVLKTFEMDQKTAYKSYYSGSGCRRRLEAAARGDAGGTEHGRTLFGGKYLTCKAPGGTTDVNVKDPAKVVFTSDTEKGLCKNMKATTDEQMTKDCEQFCKPNSIPFNLGSRIMGFEQAEMDKICLKPDEDGELYNKSKVQECHGLAGEYGKLQTATAGFIAKLQVLAWEQEAFTVEARRATEELKKTIKEKVQKTMDDAAEADKVREYIKLLNTGLKDLVSQSAAKGRLQTAASAVENEGTKLDKTLKTVMPKLQTFLNTCNLLTTGIGPDSEYLLDQCSQDSKVCIEKKTAAHRGCCCGYNPILALGRDITANTIEGLSGMNKRNRAQGDRVLVNAPTAAAASVSVTKNICGEASRQSEAAITKIKIRIEAKEKGVVAKIQAANVKKYPDFHNRCATLTKGKDGTSGAAASKFPAALELALFATMLRLWA